MSTKKTKKRSTPRKRTSAVARPRSTRRRSSPRRKKALSSGGSTQKKLTIMKTISNMGGGIVGGGVYVAPKFLWKFPLWGKILYGVGAASMANVFKSPNVGSGIMGATMLDVAQSLASVGLKDEGLEDVEYVDPSTLSETGFEDEAGNKIVMDDDGVVYALNGNGEYQAIGNRNDLPMDDDDDEGMGEDLQTVSMLPLQDIYALSGGNNYSLGAGY